MNVKLLVGFAVVFLLLLIGTASASTLVVNQTSPACTTGDKYYSTIQDAVNAAKDGDTIIVCPGTYNENVIVNKEVTIIGNGTTSVVKGTIDITADGATIKWLKIIPGSVTGNEAGIEVYASNVTIQENVICNMTGNGSGTIKGIHVYSGGERIDNITIVGNHIFNINNTDSSGSYRGANGITIQGNVYEYYNNRKYHRRYPFCWMGLWYRDYTYRH